MLFFTDEGMKWNKLIKYGELLLSLLVVLLMLLASVVYGAAWDGRAYWRNNRAAVAGLRF